MNRSLLMVFGGILVAIGLLWTLQGLGVVGGSVMSGVTLWAIIGPIVALFGVVVGVAGYRRG
ncbi:MAG: hypothetical protein ABIS35_03135 [Terracoccus sp.]